MPGGGWGGRGLWSREDFEGFEGERTKEKGASPTEPKLGKSRSRSFWMRDYYLIPSVFGSSIPGSVALFPGYDGRPCS